MEPYIAPKTIAGNIYIKQRRDVPKSWLMAAGLLRHKKKALKLHIAKMDREWERLVSRS